MPPKKNIAELDRELTSITENLEDVETLYYGPPPEIPSNSKEWADQVGGGYFGHADGSDGQRSFGPAWHRAYSLIYQIFFDSFSEWAVQAVAIFGKEKFNAADIPDPPVHGKPYGMPLLSQGTRSAVDWLAKTADTRQAGLRIIYWAAAFKNPSQFQRCFDHEALMKIWIRQTIDILWSAQGFDAPDEFVGVCRMLDELMDWVWDAFEALSEAARTAKSKNTAQQVPSDGEIPKRSYTAGELDAAVRTYKAKRASNFDELVRRVERGDEGAKKAAQKMFGRNAIARALGAARSNVTECVAWHEIAAELRLRCAANEQSRVPRPTKIGVDIAVEHKSEQQGDQTFNQVIRNETIRIIENSGLSAEQIEPMLEQLRRGDTSDEKARELVIILTQTDS